MREKEAEQAKRQEIIEGKTGNTVTRKFLKGAKRDKTRIESR